MRSPKQLCLEVLRAKHAAAEDDYSRARRQLDHLTEREMDQPYGQSDQTPRQILEKYRNNEQELRYAIFWLSHQEEDR